MERLFTCTGQDGDDVSRELADIGCDTNEHARGPHVVSSLSQAFHQRIAMDQHKIVEEVVSNLDLRQGVSLLTSAILLIYHLTFCSASS